MLQRTREAEPVDPYVSLHNANLAAAILIPPTIPLRRPRNISTTG